MQFECMEVTAGEASLIIDACKISLLRRYVIIQRNKTLVPRIHYEHYNRHIYLSRILEPQ